MQSGVRFPVGVPGTSIYPSRVLQIAAYAVGCAAWQSTPCRTKGRLWSHSLWGFLLILDRVPTWHLLQPIGASLAARATILLPIVGYLVLLNNGALEWAELAPRFRVLWPGEPWRLVATYYGLCLVAVATLIFRWRCPNSVATGDTVSEFSDSTSKFILRSQERAEEAIDQMIARTKRHPIPSNTQDQNSLLGLLSEGRELTPVETERAIQLAMSLEWRIQNSEQPFARATCTLLYGSGFAILSIPVISTFLEITVWTAGRFF